MTCAVAVCGGTALAQGGTTPATPPNTTVPRPASPNSSGAKPAPGAPAVKPGSTSVAGQGGALSTLAGVYTDAQATRGESTFNGTCLSCHVPSDYTGDSFQSKFVGGTVFDMFDDIRQSMPQDNPGSLTNEQYTDLVAYLFKLNGLPTRDRELPAVIDSLKAIKVEAKPPQSHLRHATGMHHYGSTRIR
ncbi:MAG TPA: cytochrome c [Gemmatimonadaceae bacterium]|nr:cytochrome c [Gemmatimonadaceae bacterium]